MFDTMNGANSALEVTLMVYPKKFLFGANVSKSHLGKDDLFRSFFNVSNWVWSKLSQATVTIGPLKSQDMIKTLKQSQYYFSGKCLCDGYYTQIM